MGISGEPYYHFWKRGEAKVERFRSGNTILQVQSFNPLPITSLSHHITANQIWLYRTNPEVYHSTRVTMRFAALFRYIKQQNPAGWAAFLKELEDVQTSPAVVTPALYRYFPYNSNNQRP